MKPEFWQDDKIGALKPRARLLALALISFSDDEGRFKATPSRIRVFAFPYDGVTDDDVQTYLSELVGIGYLIKGENDTYQVKNFLKHQRIDHPQPSQIPPIRERSRTLAKAPVGMEGNGREGKGSPIPSESLRDLRAVVSAFKSLKGFDDVKHWDRVNFPRAARAAKSLLLLAGTAEVACQALKDLGSAFDKKGLSWTLETVVKHFDTWTTHRPKPKMSDAERATWEKRLAVFAPPS